MNDMKPRITVLMAIYNCAETLVEALDSLMNQTYQGFKVVLCDDASTDNTYEVAQKYIKKYPDKFILIRNEENKKLPYSLNRCLEYADTEYVARMDGDDISLPERFEKEIDFLDNHKDFSFVSCPMEYFDNDGVFMTGKIVNQPTKKNFIGNSPHAHAPVMIRTQALKSVGGYTDKRWTRRGQDVHLWAKLYNSGYKGFNLDIPLYQMRDDKNAFKRRKAVEEIYGFKRTYEIFRLMGIPKYYLYIQVFALIKSLTPHKIYSYYHKKKYSKN